MLYPEKIFRHATPPEYLLAQPAEQVARAPAVEAVAEAEAGECETETEAAEKVARAPAVEAVAEADADGHSKFLSVSLSRKVLFDREWQRMFYDEMWKDKASVWESQGSWSAGYTAGNFSALS